MQKDTGVTLSEVKGLLANLNDNLSGKDGNYWIEATKKLLRKEEIPPRPPEVIKNFNSQRISAREKLQEIVDYLNTLPAVHEATLCSEDDGGDLISIHLYNNLITFINGYTNNDTPLFSLGSDNIITRIGGGAEDDLADYTFKEWVEDTNTFAYDSINKFCKAIIKLGNMYEKSVPKVSK